MSHCLGLLMKCLSRKIKRRTKFFGMMRRYVFEATGHQSFIVTCNSVSANDEMSSLDAFRK